VNGTEGEELTGSFNESRIMLGCHERVREFAEELFQEPGNAIHVVKEIFRIAEVYSRCI
jgi:hypothetical protein